MKSSFHALFSSVFFVFCCRKILFLCLVSKSLYFFFIIILCFIHFSLHSFSHVPFYVFSRMKLVMKFQFLIPIPVKFLDYTNTVFNINKFTIVVNQYWKVQYIGRYLALYFCYWYWPISFSNWPMCRKWDFYFESADNDV